MLFALHTFKACNLVWTFFSACSSIFAFIFQFNVIIHLLICILWSIKIFIFVPFLVFSSCFTFYLLFIYFFVNVVNDAWKLWSLFKSVLLTSFMNAWLRWMLSVWHLIDSFEVSLFPYASIQYPIQISAV